MNLEKLDLVTKLRKLLDNQGYILRTDDSKFVPRITSIGYDAPWIYVQGQPEARCDLYHRIFFRQLDHIHSFCRSCWKIVVRPQTLVQLMDLYELQKSMGVPCKCGLELRKTVSGEYGGYFYTRSYEEGWERYKEVRELVDQNLGTEVSVILKRYCTEFELEGLPSNEVVDCTEEEKEMERYVEAHIPQVAPSNPQPKHLVAVVLRRWIHHAMEHGDETYLEFTNGEKLVPSYVTYHEEE